MSQWWGGVAVAAAVVAARAGHTVDLARPNFLALEDGKTTVEDAIALLGEPFQRGPGDDPATTILIYNYMTSSAGQKEGILQLAAVLVFDKSGVLKEHKFYERTK